MTAELQRCRDAQVEYATLLLAGHPEHCGLRQALSDEFAEDLEICGLGRKPAIPWPGCGCWYCRGCSGWPNDEAACEIAAKRLSQEVLEF